MSENLFKQLDGKVQQTLKDVAEKIIVPAFHAYGVEGAVCIKPDQSIVTKTDFEAQDFLEQSLIKLIGDCNFLGEEVSPNGLVYNEAEWTWIVDPIDGTHNFAAHNIDFGTMVSLWNNKDQKPHYGWIYLPMYGVMLSGGASVGVFNNNQPLDLQHTSHRKPIKEMLGILNYMSFGTARDIMRYNGQIFYEVTDSSCAALKFVEIIMGKADFGAFGRAKLWDLCAGFALIDAIGGKAAKIDGSPLVLKPPSGKNEWCLAVHDKATWQPVRDQLFRDVELSSGTSPELQSSNA